VVLSVCLPVVVLWPALSMCMAYLMGPSAVEADATARYGNCCSVGHPLDETRVRARRGVRSRELGEGVLLRGRGRSLCPSQGREHVPLSFGADYGLGNWELS